MQQAAEREAGEDTEMGESKEAELQQEAADREAAFNAKKKAKLEKPSPSSDKGTKT